MRTKTFIGFGGTLALLLGILLLAAAPASAVVKSVKFVKATPRALFFDVRGFRSATIDKAWVKMAGNGTRVKRPVRVSLVSKKAASGKRLRLARPDDINRGNLMIAITPSSPAAPSAPTDMVVGINGNSQAWGPDTGQQQDKIAKTGVGWLREDFAWNVIEPRRGQYDWSRYDNVMAEASSRGLMVLPVLMATPGWAGDTWDTIPSDPTDYADFVAQVVGRYGNGGSFWAEHPELDSSFAITHYEIWNEPYLGVFSNGDADPARYARLVKAASKAGRAVDPSSQYLLEADISATNDWVEWHDWIDAMYKAVPNLGDYFDEVAVHPYTATSPTDWDPRDTVSRWQTPRIEDIRQKFVAHGDGDKHFWVTEIGWSTCTGDSDCVTESQQAAYLAKFFQLANTQYSGWLDGVFVYNYSDFGEGDPTDKEQWFGLTREDGTAKPAMNVLQSVTGAS